MKQNIIGNEKNVLYWPCVQEVWVCSNGVVFKMAFVNPFKTIHFGVSYHIIKFRQK